VRRGALLGVALALGALATPAVAQRATPVEGGGSFTDAPVVPQGTYSDTIRLTEELLYGVELAEGQRLKVTARMLGQRGGPSDAFALAQLQVYSSLRNRWSSNELEVFDGVIDSDPWSISSPKIGGGAEFSEEEEIFAQPGTYYFSLKFFRNVGLTRQSPILKREFKTRYKVEVIGDAVEPSPTPTPTPTAEPSPTETEDPGGAAAAPSEPASADTPYVRVYLMTFLIGLLAGFGIVVVRGLGARRARSA